MGYAKPFVRRSKERGATAVAVIDDALADDGQISGAEVPMVCAAVRDWFAMTDAADQAESLAGSIRCGAGETDDRYVAGKFAEFRRLLDELPEGIPA